MQVNHLSQENSLLNHFLKEIRDKKVQTDAMRFRKNMERIGNIMAYEISKSLSYRKEEISTPLADMMVDIVNDKIVVVAILRAAIHFHAGILNFFDHAETAFISTYRKYNESHTNFEIVTEYLASPSLEGKTLILCDPMLATGGSMELSYKALVERGTPKAIHVASIIASEQGIAYVQQQLPANTTIWTAAIDPELNESSYIVPGLGDAGDLAYGQKL